MLSTSMQSMGAAHLFCVKKLPFVYLSCPLLKGAKKSGVVQKIKDNFNAKLVGWKQRLSSPSGRLLLSNRVPSAIPTHVLEVIKPPKVTLKSLEQLTANIFSGESNGIPKRH
ncbi:hypothetical protein ACH5RR_013133 [Cinchona calisaya]|uniref:Uncharacterized protein n=1 Tax=Cinchona calisaya TaxID=153742 RepID=A0ABD2ZZ71_9GENT